MSLLTRLNIQQLRNITSTSINLSPRINLFYGENGSGKTSVLEAISLLGLGRSFRSHKSRSLVNHNVSELIVFADIFTGDVSLPVGIQKAKTGTGTIRVAGETIRSASVLAKQLPLLIVNASSFQLIEGSPLQRRQFLDWMVFHVKPEFASLWKGLQKTLKQRNSLLRRDKISYSELQPWDVELCRLAYAIDEARKAVFFQFIEIFEVLKKAFLDDGLEVEMEYVSGWDQQQKFADILIHSFDRDARDGYTHFGPQRAEIKIRSKQKKAADVLSRGQEKALICAMTVAQAQLYKASLGKGGVFLIDDLLAELDVKHSQRLAGWLTQLNSQVFVTGVEKEGLLRAWENECVDIEVFHVKQGDVTKDISKQ